MTANHSAAKRRPRHGCFAYLAGTNWHLRLPAEAADALQDLAERLAARYGVAPPENRSTLPRDGYAPAAPSASSNPAVEARLTIALRLMAVALKAERVIAKRGFAPGGDPNGLLSHLDRFMRSADSIIESLEAQRQKSGSSKPASYVDTMKRVKGA